MSQEPRAEPSTPIPPEDMIFLTSGHRDADAFAVQRRICVDEIIGLLGDVGVDYRSFESILDFGCGCGRILAGWEGLLPPGSELFGVDINAHLVEFCRTHLPFATVERCSYLSPLPLERRFDFVYAASVFTHLTLDAAMAWAAELVRVVRPGGHLLMTYHGTWYLPQLAGVSKRGADAVEDTGFHVHLHVEPEQTHLGANHYAAYMSTPFVRSLFKGFELLRVHHGLTSGPRSLASYQDIAVLRRLPG